MGTMCDNFIIYEDNQNEFKMWQGLVGAHYTPYVDGEGNLSWTNNGGLPNPPTVNVTGKGLTITGIVATTGDLPATANQFDTYLVGTADPYYAYMYYENAWVNIGAVGKGEQGDPGFSPVITVSPITGGHQISITDAEDTETFDVMDGADGQDGVGVPSGGTTGQVLAKRSGTNYDTEWVNQSGGAGPATVAPLMDGTAAVGTSTKYAREDHVHPTDTSRQETLVSGTNIKTVGGQSLLGSGNIDAGGALYYTSVACSAMTGNFATVSNAAITANHVVVGVEFAKTSVTNAEWTTASGSLVLNGTCSAATTADIVLVLKNN